MLVRVSQSEGAAEAVAGAFYPGAAVPAAQRCYQPIERPLPSPPPLPEEADSPALHAPRSLPSLELRSGHC